MEVIEVRNEGDQEITVSVCRSKLSGRLYIHIGEIAGNHSNDKVEPQGFCLVEVREVDF